MGGVMGGEAFTMAAGVDCQDRSKKRSTANREPVDGRDCRQAVSPLPSVNVKKPPVEPHTTREAFSLFGDSTKPLVELSPLGAVDVAGKGNRNADDTHSVTTSC
jgi:hypothetical protein